jgi:hypothetical protein
MYINYKKERTVVFRGIDGYASLPQRYVIRTFPTLVSRTFIIKFTFFLFLIEGIPLCLNSTRKINFFIYRQNTKTVSKYSNK